MNSQAETRPADWGPLSELPGNPIMWVLVISELVAFGAFLLSFGVARVFHPDLFAAGQAMLDLRLGGLNTLILVTSGWLAAKAVQQAAEGRPGDARPWLAGAGGLGLAFLVVKGVEYADKAKQGIGIDTDTFWTLFYLITGFHAVHVVMGVVILAIVGWRNSQENLETGTAFWHMVDLVWLIIFPILYLVR